jgi:hypothetical protein
MEGQMKHFYNAVNQQDENIIRDMVHQTINSLRHFPDQAETVRLGIDAQSAQILARLIEIGIAPGGNELPNSMRDRIAQFGKVQLQVTRTHATELAAQIEVGMARHENGVDDPSTFVLH